MSVIREKVKQLRIWFMQDKALLTLLIVTGVYFMLYYVTDPVRPTGLFSIFGFGDSIGYPQGWFGYYDQGQYLNIAHTLANLDFSELHKSYTYGLGYPIVAVPALWLGFEGDPFIFFNFFAFLFAVYAVYRVAGKLISPVAGLLAGLGLVFATPLVHYVDQPWNSTVCVVVMSAILLTWVSERITKERVFVLGILLGWALAARYVDVLWLGVLAVASVYRGSFKEVVSKWLLPGAVGFAIIVIPVLYSHDKFFGSPLKTPYVNHLGLNGNQDSDQGLKAYSIKRVPRSGLALFFSPRLAGSPDGDRGLFIDMFWGLLAIPGAFVLYRIRKYRVFVITFGAMTVLAWLFYLSFRASTPGSLKFGELHYFKMFWLPIVIFSTAYIDYFLRWSGLITQKTAPSTKQSRPKKLARK